MDISGDNETGRDKYQEVEDYSSETIQGTKPEEFVENIAHVLNETVCKPHKKEEKCDLKPKHLVNLL